MHEKQSIYPLEYENFLTAKIKTLLAGIYGEKKGNELADYAVRKSEDYLRERSEEQLKRSKSFGPGNPYKDLAGRVFAICYPDNIRTKGEYTLKTLGKTLSEYFPAINGIHILPERLMAHKDVLEQDFYYFCDRAKAADYILSLKKDGVLDENNFVTKYFESKRDFLNSSYPNEIMDILDSAYNYHFNDGGFSQKTRKLIDPRFGTSKELSSLSEKYGIMLDFVVNHLDIDNPALDEYRGGKGNGDCFIIVSPEEYEEMKENGDINKTFRPRPFPLYTGMRTYPGGLKKSLLHCASDFNEKLLARGLSGIDIYLAGFASIFFKVKNDQGLSLEDLRVLDGFKRFLIKKNIDERDIFRDSPLHEGQPVFIDGFFEDVRGFLTFAGCQAEQTNAFLELEEETFGRIFYAYTTFSESQVDVNPLSGSGFKMIVDDLFELLSSGNLSMMRMDAIKYLWKEKGKVNFDMPEGNKLIDAIRAIMRLAAPEVLPLDEVNSPDPAVYKMGRGGGFYYLFGPVNTTTTAINIGDLTPIENMYNTKVKLCPDDLVLFVTLSTHDGRSVQGLGVQSLNGNVSIKRFYELKSIVESQGGKPKYRSVPRGIASRELYQKVLMESGLDRQKEALDTVFSPDGDEEIRIDKEYLDRNKLLTKISEICGRGKDALAEIPAIDYFLEWICDGKTVYELCATSRGALCETGFDGKPLSPEIQAKRLALAQLFVLTMGQDVPAIYFNDLFGLVNDTIGYKLSGKPRDLNRKKLNLDGPGIIGMKSPFFRAYVPLLNEIIRHRTGDRAFYPGSRQFEYKSLTKRVFLNHPFHDNRHSLIIGNISGKEEIIELKLRGLAGTGGVRHLYFKDQLSDAEFTLNNKGPCQLTIPAYGAYYFKSVKA